jgi:hypothetical protein
MLAQAATSELSLDTKKTSKSRETIPFNPSDIQYAGTESTVMCSRLYVRITVIPLM